MQYVDVFKKPISKQEVAIAVREIIAANKPGTLFIVRRLRFGYAKASAIMSLLEDAGVVSLTHNNKRTILLKNTDAAINAALRQLKKGNR